MSLLQLLTTGKSLVGLTEAQPRYRISRERFLPQFGPTRNPFCWSDKLDPARAEACIGTERAPAPSQPNSAKAGPSPGNDPSGVPCAAVSKSTTLVVSPDRRKAAQGVVTRAAAIRTPWIDKLRTVFSRRVGKPAELAFSVAPKPQAQGELALEKIKVARNDLSDADLEVVPAKLPTVRGQATPALPSFEKAVMGGVPRGRLSGLFRADKA